MARNSQEIEDIVTTEAKEQDLLGEDEVSEQDCNEMPNVLKNLSKVLTDMSSSMLSMEQLMKRINQGKRSDPPAKKRQRSNSSKVQEDGAASDTSDGENLLNATEPPVDSATEGQASVTCARLEHDALLSEISQDFDQEEDLGPNINQQLADIINKRWLAKLNEAKVKEKMEKYFQPTRQSHV